MSDEALAAVLAEAERAGRPPEEALRRHVLEGLLRRLAGQPFAEQLVLRGGLLMRAWTPTARPTRDLDFVGLFGETAADAVDRFAALQGPVTPDDGVRFEPAALRARRIWEETDFPGVRVFVRAGFGEADTDVQVDIGFRDPLVPPAEQIDFPCLFGGPARAWAVRPATMLAWKLHALAEHGERRWRPKDLHDIGLIGAAVPPSPAELAPAIAAAFLSRGYTLAQAATILTAGWWASRRVAARWEAFRAETPAALGLAEALTAARAAVADGIG